MFVLQNSQVKPSILACKYLQMGAPRDLEMIFTQNKSKDGMAQFVKIVVADTQLSTVKGSQQTVTDGGDEGQWVSKDLFSRTSERLYLLQI